MKNPRLKNFTAKRELLKKMMEKYGIKVEDLKIGKV